MQKAKKLVIKIYCNIEHRNRSSFVWIGVDNKRNATIQFHRHTVDSWTVVGAVDGFCCHFISLEIVMGKIFCLFFACGHRLKQWNLHKLN